MNNVATLFYFFRHLRTVRLRIRRFVESGDPVQLKQYFISFEVKVHS